MPGHADTDRIGALTARQREVLQLVARGYSNPHIGEVLGISLDGAKWHVSEILTRLDVSSREEAAAAWRSYSAPRARLHRLFAPAAAAVSSGKWLAASLAGAACAGLVVIAVLAFRAGGNATEQAQSSAESPVAPASLGRANQPSGMQRIEEAAIDARTGVAGVRVVPAGQPASWDQSFLPVAGKQLTTVNAESELGVPFPYNSKAAPDGYTLDAAQFEVGADDAGTMRLVRGGLRYTAAARPFAVTAELYGVKSGATVEVNAWAPGTGSSLWSYVTPAGAEVLVSKMSPGGGETVFEAHAARAGVYVRIDAPGLSQADFLEFLNRFMSDPS